ncbi:GspE/PulE family protein [Victivallis sp. Marseille-Q1083]|uniref:GspE/PulE family protein n=1 Tax=Victivallis sp. Marseille-Q1083 TaxID=2717288 RepID=UPI00158BAC4A|nr:ATPase, T2SS/T4P/T4SS family [Victivallis sp. Marseille-Q1083]
MVFRITPEQCAAYRSRLEKILAERCGDEYEKLRRNLLPPAEADRMLTERGLLSENDLLAIYCRELQVEAPDEDELVLPEKLADVNEEYLSSYTILPGRWDENVLEIWAADPYLLDQHRYVFEQFFHREVVFQLVRRTLLERWITKVYWDETESAPQDGESESMLRQLAGEARIVRLVNEMLSQALEQSASDIHIEPEEESLVIRFRVDGILREYLSLPVNDYPAIASRIKLIGGLNIAESRLPQDGRTKFQIGRFDIDIRISTIPVMHGESIVMRLLRNDAMRFDLRELGMNQALLNRFGRLIQLPHGIILVVGPTGSGKTTTLYSVMQQLNDRKRKIITIEDPVEYQLAGLSQMQVNPKIGVTFAAGLRHIVRQDPDVILVGEIRDRETAEIAINAALTGHLVLSTLHTNDAVGALTRLVDMGIEPFLISSALCGVLSQRLVRKVCTVCQASGHSGSQDGRCRNCGGSGYRGRSGIYELLILDEEIRAALGRKEPGSRLNEIAVCHGMIPLLDDGRDKVAAGITTEAEILRIASSVREGGG